MNIMLMANRPIGEDGKPMDKKEWELLWERQGYTLEPLAKTIQTLANEANSVNAKDFDCPNHYAKLAYEAGMREAYQRILNMLPKKSSM